MTQITIAKYDLNSYEVCIAFDVGEVVCVMRFGLSELNVLRDVINTVEMVMREKRSLKG